MILPLSDWNDGLIPHRHIASIEGDWPRDLRGSLLRIGPGLFQRGCESIAHLLDGDGLAQRWSFSENGPSHACTYVQTDKFQCEQQAGQFLSPGLASPLQARRQIRRPDDQNTANTNLVEIAGTLYALWEAGSAYTLDLTSLSTRGIKTWSPETATAPFGAHPKRDQQGRLWNIGVGTDTLIIYEIDPSGSLRRQRVHRLRTSALVHDFVITERYLVVALAPLWMDRPLLQQGIMPLDAMIWDDNSPSRLVVIHRDCLSIHRIVECEPELIFHMVNGWDTGDELYLHGVRTNVSQLRDGLSLLPDRQQLAHAEPSQAMLRQVALETGCTQLEILPGYVEFPQIDPRWIGRRHRYAFHLLRHELSDDQRGFNAIQCTDLIHSVEQRWAFQAGFQLEEHVLIPPAEDQQEAGGWLIGTGFDTSRQASFCSIFEAQALEQGPLAMAYLNGAVPPCFHGPYIRAEAKGSSSVAAASP